MKVIHLLITCLFFYSSFGQIVNKNRISKRFLTNNDTIHLEKVAISPINLVVKDSLGNVLPNTEYTVNYQKGQLYFHGIKNQKVEISYFKYPEFLTQSYSPFDKNLIIPKATISSKTYSLKRTYTKSDFFGGINTYGNITRGISIGNNQGSVLNSGLDLQVTGSLSDNLKIRASIKDSSVPIQENGVSQNINEFDRVFIELFTDTWNIKAGDVDITNQDSYFLNFTKKINGAKLDVVLDNGDQKTTITASGALAKGRFNTQNITPREGNQGPYQLQGANGEQNIVVISGSEVVYVNGLQLKRGEQHDYTIDYNISEITFNATFPINSTQRIIVDFQYSDQNYNRFITHDGVKYETEKFSIGTYFYNENDIKDQEIQQTLNDEQKNTLKEAGNNPEKMISNSAEIADFDENRIQYILNSEGNFEQSSDETATLHNVTFSFVGSNNGNYIIREISGIGTIYEYIAPLETGVLQGDYAPVVQLFAPTKIQVATINASYKINEESFLNGEVAYSNNDQNLFSSIDDEQNQGVATTLTWKQRISNGNWKSHNLFNFDFVQKNFTNIEGLYNAEFNRDWNIDINSTPNSLGNQTYLRNSFSLDKNATQRINFNNAYLNLGQFFTGVKSGISTFNTLGDIIIATETSYLKNSGSSEKGTFLRHKSDLKYNFQKTWLQGLLTFENNDKENEQTKALSINNQKYLSTELHFGIGDSTKVYSKFGAAFTQIDSVRSNKLTRVQNAQNFSIESQLIKNSKTSLNAFANYRKVNHLFSEDVDVVNARLLYNQRLFNNIVSLSTAYETSSGNTTQQNFTYIETEAGQGFYYYLGDLNNDGLRNFEEFEVALFKDQANYLRVVLPNTNTVTTQNAKLSQSVFLNFIQYNKSTSKWLKLLSHFSNQSSILIDKDQLKVGNSFNLNPFDLNNDNVISLRQNIQTNLYYNRGLQNYSTTYSYQNNQNTQNISSNIQVTTEQSHELNFSHNIEDSWILGMVALTSNNKNTNTDFGNNSNFNINALELSPSLNFLKDEFSTISASYSYKDKENTIGDEVLTSHNFGMNYSYNKLNKGSVIADVNLIENNYLGDLNSPASYRILEGLQPDRNYTWSIIIQRKLTKLLDLSINYNGRKNEETNAIHVGSIQLRANF